MKVILISVAVIGSIALAGCGTLGGVMQGAGEDLQRAGEWVRTR